jgi:hypothetical protein
MSHDIVYFHKYGGTGITDHLRIFPSYHHSLSLLFLIFESQPRPISIVSLKFLVEDPVILT